MTVFKTVLHWSVLLFFCIYSIGGMFNPVSAHATLERATPAAKEVVSQSPHHIELQMSEPVNTTYSTLTIYNDQGHKITTEKPKESGFSKQISFNVPSLEKGSHLVEWEATAQDGHTMHGTYIFSIGHSTATAIDKTQPIWKDVSLWWGAMRFLLQSMLLLFIGLYYVNRIMKYEGLPTYPVLLRHRGVTVMLCLWVLGTSVLYLMTLPQSVIDNILRLQFDTWLQFPFILSMTAVMTLLILLALRNMEQIWYDTLPVILLIALAMSGHVWAQEIPVYAILIRTLHLSAIALWLGTLLYLMFYIFTQHRHSYVLILRSIILKLNICAVVVIIVTGVLMTIDQISFTHLFRHMTTYLSLWISKVVFTLLMIGLGAYQTFKMMKQKKCIHRKLLITELLIGIVLVLFGIIMSQINL
ncbi:copper resistance protein CopC/CopD [Staphylococcus agnetis]|uniref:copper resistance CopC/CopD family protein n=1 Tax=Staphylococcus agnetis TaxID=985762 RepID=UPI00208E02F0|nr:copper resistance protein CopC [Staphylococcus agnetis]MCO4345118.1 copper resistance protein CopC/CopD [Staphylococcus agnetis]MCO4354624.1 copper resistance protein CopC/CopD [Staphylococcus agnetis]MCO4359316.1 copper resistance protein CopC/CopD [Staphylococcus agnetis]MCO4363928.1 copper resistance protein CopC/CopD [Staphylococcus agnetis]MCO4371071.1 copper resistance protein CopC/CopD [Staphylococcus agnetis]